MSSITTGLPTEPLTPERENYLASLKTEEAHNELALHAMHEALPYARKCCRAALPDDELFSWCWTSLLKAARQFKPNRTRFFAYAKVSVRRGICDAWREKDVVRHASVNEALTLGHVARIPAHHEGADDGTFRADGDYPENLLGESNRDFAGHFPAHVLAGGIVEPEFDAIHTRERWTVVEPLLRKRLSKNEYMTLDLHYRGEMNFQEIGDILGVVREAIKKIRLALNRQKHTITK
jgi:RNA polymerase sigma factor (sigma-70 family)